MWVCENEFLPAGCIVVLAGDTKKKEDQKVTETGDCWTDYHPNVAKARPGIWGLMGDIHQILTLTYRRSDSVWDETWRDDSETILNTFCLYFHVCANMDLVCSREPESVVESQVCARLFNRAFSFRWIYFNFWYRSPALNYWTMCLSVSWTANPFFHSSPKTFGNSNNMVGKRKKKYPQVHRKSFQLRVSPPPGTGHRRWT